MMSIRPEVWPFILATIAIFGLLALIMRLRGGRRSTLLAGAGLPALILIAYFLYFFRDPERTAPTDPALVVAAADGRIAAITNVHEPHYLKTDCVRISIFLSLFDVHVNRAPISGKSTFLGYFPGRRLFTFQEKASEVNQHNKILMENDATRCLITQIVGPVCRRVVYWPDHDRPVALAKGERIGMMKFGSRLDMYFPVGEIEILTAPGTVVRAGETPVARLKLADNNNSPGFP